MHLVFFIFYSFQSFDDRKNVLQNSPNQQLAATLNQNGKPVAFHARTLLTTEQRHSDVKKEVYAIVEALGKYKHLLLGKYFTLITDQRSVSFMLEIKHISKIKNDKTIRWQLQPAAFDFRIICRPVKLNFTPDTLSRAISPCVPFPSLNSLTKLRESLCHPRITRLAHNVKLKSLSYSLNDVKKCYINLQRLQRSKNFFP